MSVRSADPALSYQFAVEVTEDPFGFLGFKIPITGYFSEISGLNVEWETAEYKTVNFLGLAHSNTKCPVKNHEFVAITAV